MSQSKEENKRFAEENQRLAKEQLTKDQGEFILTKRMSKEPGDMLRTEPIDLNIRDTDTDDEKRNKMKEHILSVADNFYIASGHPQSTLENFCVHSLRFSPTYTLKEITNNDGATIHHREIFFPDIDTPIASVYSLNRTTAKEEAAILVLRKMKNPHDPMRKYIESRLEDCIGEVLKIYLAQIAANRARYGY